MDQGFSLTEVLVSLLLVTTASLTLLKHQWQTSQLFNQIHTRTTALSLLDNAAEQFYMGYHKFIVDLPFKLQYKISPKNSFRAFSFPESSMAYINITWATQHVLERHLVAELSYE